MKELEAIKALKEILLEDKDSEIKVARSFLEDIVQYFENQSKIGEWIPCSKRLPSVEDLHEKSIEDCKSYLIQRNCGVIGVAHYIKVYGEFYFSSHALKITDVIAWQPLPEPYRGEK